MHIARGDIDIKGIRVETYGTPGPRPPLLLVHGGTQGSWAWERMAPALAERGWYAVCLNWFGHHGSRSLPLGEALVRSIPMVGEEIATVSGHLEQAPVVVAHSMGGLASLVHASHNPVPALVLITPVVPREFGGDPIDIAREDDRLWVPPPGFPVDDIFWDEVDASSAERYRALLAPESPRAVREAAEWLVDIDVSTVVAPTLLFGAERDLLVPAGSVESLASAMGGHYVALPDAGHGVPLNPVHDQVVRTMDRWLLQTLAPDASSR